jgi:hypothetical protein
MRLTIGYMDPAPETFFLETKIDNILKDASRATIEADRGLPQQDVHLRNFR